MRKFILAAVFCAPLLLVAAPAGDLRMAAEQGDAATQCRLGLAYASGEGVARDAKEAVKWWRLAAEQDDAQAQSLLGWAYSNGEGVVQDAKEAVKWSRKAA